MCFIGFLVFVKNIIANSFYICKLVIMNAEIVYQISRRIIHIVNDFLSIYYEV